MTSESSEKQQAMHRDKWSCEQTWTQGFLFMCHFGMDLFKILKDTERNYIKEDMNSFRTVKSNAGWRMCDFQLSIVNTAMHSTLP